jgi:hypothetical protein
MADTEDPKPLFATPTEAVACLRRLLPLCCNNASTEEMDAEAMAALESLEAEVGRPTGAEGADDTIAQLRAMLEHMMNHGVYPTRNDFRACLDVLVAVERELRLWKYHPVENVNRELRAANNRQTARVAAAEARISALESELAEKTVRVAELERVLGPFEALPALPSEPVKP